MCSSNNVSVFSHPFHTPRQSRLILFPAAEWPVCDRSHLGRPGQTLWVELGVFPVSCYYEQTAVDDLLMPRFRRGHVYLHGPRVRFRVRGEMNLSFKKKKKSPRFSPEGLRQFAFVLLMDKVSPYPPCLVIGVWNLWIVG